jgi:acetate kinase
VEEALPGIPQVAVFDTAYYCHMPEKSFIYPLPYEWYEEWGIRRFGFHGISHAYCAERAAEMTGDNSTELRIVSCHLGNGCSATATWNSAAVATTMGFTPMEGLMMGTRSGSIDPGILLYLQQSGRLSTEELDHALNHQSGLLGVSGISSDFRQVERASMKGDERARLALDIFADRVRGAIGALAVNMSGIDVLVFTGGIGENSSSLRTMVCKGMECLGLRLDSERNNKCQPDCDIADKGSSVRILVVHTNEELLIAREARRLNET